MHALELRQTHKYVGTYQHEDKWEQIGTFDEIGIRDLPKSEQDEEDPCEPISRELFVLVKSDRPDAEITRALHDSHTQHGCHHEHDCCGCWSHSVGEAKRVTGDLWRVVVNSARNF